jgi:hypothetical protein
MRLSRVLVAIAFVWSTPAIAKDMNGKLGIGVTQTLGGVTGIGVRYWPSKRFSLEVTVGVSLIDKDNVRSSTAVYASTGVFYAFILKRHANLSVGLRGNLGFRSTPRENVPDVSVGDAIDNETSVSALEAIEEQLQVNLEIPLLVEYFFSDSFSVNLAVGLVLVIVPDEGGLLEVNGVGGTSKSGEIGFGIGAGGVFGSAGFTFYF